MPGLRSASATSEPPIFGVAVSVGERVRPRKEVIRAAACRFVLGSPRKQSSACKHRRGPMLGSILGWGGAGPAGGVKGALRRPLVALDAALLGAKFDNLTDNLTSGRRAP
jgi:hypothetical protein